VPAVYVTMNPCKPELLARAENKTVNWAKNTTSDADILHRKWLLIDLDPVRPSGISSTDTEHEAAMARAEEVKAFLTDHTFPEPIIADSGNGAHLMYRIDLENNDENRNLIRKVLAVLDVFFTDENTEIDKTVYNAARIVKLYGTMACKGDNTETRPHRISSIISVPEEIQVVSEEVLQAFTNLLPDHSSSGTTKSSSINISDWLKDHDIEVAETKNWNGSEMHILGNCPFNPDHTGKCAFILQFPNGGIMAKCHHNSCSDKGWADLRDMHEPGWRDAEEDDPSQKQVDQIISIAESAELILDEYGKPFASIEHNGHKELQAVSSTRFKQWLTYKFHKHTRQAPSGDALSKAINVIESEAGFTADIRKLWLRVGQLDDAIYYDLADPDYRIVKITTEGWETSSQYPLIFRRHANTAPQVEPVDSPNGIFRLFEYINLNTEEDKNLLLVYIVSCLIPDVPHVVGVFSGEKGAAKSTTLRILRSLIDPAKQDLLTIPRTTEELALTLFKNYVPAFDNLEELGPRISNMLCTASTGGGISKRALYTNEEEIIFSFKRCILLNGIVEVVTRPDLLDRSLSFTLNRIDPTARREESELWESFEQDKPVILGAMFTTLSKAMSIYIDVNLNNLPRMADFARWGYSIAEALEIGGEKFLEIYYRNIIKSNETAINASPLATIIVNLMEERDQYINTIGNFLDEMERIAFAEHLNTSSREWPKSSNKVQNSLRKIKSNLVDAGIKYEISKITSGEHKGKTQIKITKALLASSINNSDANPLPSGEDHGEDNSIDVTSEESLKYGESGDGRHGEDQISMFLKQSGNEEKLDVTDYF